MWDLNERDESVDIALPPDGRLRLRAPGDLFELAKGWVPLMPSPEGAAGDGSTRAYIDMARAEPHVRNFAAAERDAVAGAPAFEQDGVRVWVRGDRAFAAGEAAACDIDLLARRARLYVAETPLDTARTEVFSLLSAAAALLVGRLGGALVHAGAVAPGDGPATLLVGGSGSGKTTTCANLVRAGWRGLADDQVVLTRDDSGAIVAHGFARPFGLDAGWPDGAPRGQKRRVDPRRLAGGGLIPSAPLGQIALPRVTHDAATEARPASPAQTLAALLQQSAWLTYDPAAAKPLFDLLAAAATLGGRHLRLGLDAFAEETAPLTAAFADGV